MSFGNVNVAYTPCKSVGQLKSAEKYMLGKKSEQIKAGVIKTQDNLYTALGCNRDNFANNVLVTRKLNGKSYGKHKDNTILAHKMSLSFHPDDNYRITYDMAFNIAKDFAEYFIHSKGYEVLSAVHIDTDHVHAHLLISNCNMDTGKSYRRNQKDLYEMSEYFGKQCLSHGLVNSVRNDFYNHDLNKQRDKEIFAEKQMKLRGKETFKDELREVIRLEVDDPNNHTFDDVIKALNEHYNVECRVSGNTVSYRHPEYKDKNGKLVSVRGNKLGELYTRKGIEHELTKKQLSISENHGTASTNTVNTDYRFDTAEDRLRNFVADGNRTSGNGQTGCGGQVPSVTAASNNRANVQDNVGFHDRNREQSFENEQRPNEITEPPRSVQKRNKSRGR